MATGAVPASFSGLKGRDSSLGFAKSMDLVRVCDLKRIKFGRTRIFLIRNQNPGPDIAELQPASEGSPLLGNENSRQRSRYSADNCSREERGRRMF